MRAGTAAGQRMTHKIVRRDEEFAKSLPRIDELQRREGP
jgi:hypothetical protein